MNPLKYDLIWRRSKITIPYHPSGIWWINYGWSNIDEIQVLIYNYLFEKVIKEQNETKR